MMAFESVRMDFLTIRSETEREVRIIQRFIKLHYMEMYERWIREGGTDFYQDK